MPFLTWETRPTDTRRAARVPYYTLKSGKTYGDAAYSNLLVQGDNLAALKSLLPHYAQSVKCIFIDPPYNTGNAFEQYDDNMEHTKWLEMMYPRLILLRDMLAEDGSIWVTLDDTEAHYMKVIMDEIFGRKNFIANIAWNSTKSVTNTALISVAHTNILLYFKHKEYYVENRREFRLPFTEEDEEGFENPDNDPNGPWKADPFKVGGWRPNQQYEIVNPATGKKHTPGEGQSWKNDYNKYQRLVAEGRIVFGKGGDGQPLRKRYLSEARERGKVAQTIWPDVGTTTDGTTHGKGLHKKGFPNPKPEELIQRILQLATRPNDLVLDSFLGSGTTAAVAHKMGRRWLGIEMGDHAITHCIPRLEQVIQGEEGGISKAVEWKGGGGFHFVTLGEPIFDKYGNTNPNLNFDDLAAHVWFAETQMPFPAQKHKTPFLGTHRGTGYALLYNGILRDKSVDGGNVLTSATLQSIRAVAPDGFTGDHLVVYGNACRLQGPRLARENVTFRQIPYDFKESR